MDYETATDFEINKAVAKILRPELTPLSEDDSFNARGDSNEVHFLQFRFFFDYCNNPTDAWPIIVENKICLEADSRVMGEWSALGGMFNGLNYDLEYSHANPLRAAMIVFLKIKEWT